MGCSSQRIAVLFCTFSRFHFWPSNTFLTQWFSNSFFGHFSAVIMLHLDIGHLWHTITSAGYSLACVYDLCSPLPQLFLPLCTHTISLASAQYLALSSHIWPVSAISVQTQYDIYIPTSCVLNLIHQVSSGLDSSFGSCGGWQTSTILPKINY